jgi:hypothetical protein
MYIGRYAACAAVLIALASNAADAAIQRTFVKSTGIDNPVCSLAAPCRSFAAAITNTLPGGEVIVLDSAGYGPVAINKSVSIIAPRGVYAGISVDAAATAGITVGTSGIVVVLQGLSINGIGGSFGIRILQDAEVHIINCTVANMTSEGILAFAGVVFVSDSLLRDNAGRGALINGPVSAVFERVRADNNDLAGIVGSSGASVSIRESVLVANGGGGAGVSSSGGLTTRMTVDDTLISDSATGGGASITVNGGNSVGYLDVIRSTSTRDSAGSGVSVVAFPPSTAIATVTDSLLTDNSVYGLIAGSGAVALATGNTISRNGSGGLRGSASGIVHTRSNNTGEQAPPTSGTVVAVPGF